MSNQLQNFLQKDLIVELGLQDLSEEKKEEMLLRIGELIQQNVILRILSEMLEEDKKEFEKILAEDDGDKILEFLQAKFPNLKEIAEEEVAGFKREAIAQMQGIFKQ